MRSEMSQAQPTPSVWSCRSKICSRTRQTHCYLITLCVHCRKLRLSNKKVQEELVNVSGGLEFLQAAGFQLVFDEADGCGPVN